MKFVDEATITVHAGKGGAGSRSFRREKFIPLGGPDGGNGGHGGSVILKADPGLHTLLDFKFKPQWKADDGEAGAGSLRDGKAGADLIIKVPVGTQIFRVEDPDELVADIDSVDAEFVLARGGRGGKGNNYFKSATNQAPEHFQPGEEGDSGEYLFSLKLVADVGLLGLPNAGKSTLISRISAAKPKIADYPFTTLVPNLGVVYVRAGESFVVADIPGLIPGASEGKGLGIRFLKHVERTKVLVHLVDLMQFDEAGGLANPVDSFLSINKELSLFSEELGEKKQIVALTKVDAVTDKERLKEIEDEFSRLGFPPLIISSISGEGVDRLIQVISKLLKE